MCDPRPRRCARWSSSSSTGSSASSQPRRGRAPPDRSESMPLALRSPAFGHGAAIPPQYTCDDADRSPALEWSGAPPATRSYALIVDDPDAPDPAMPKMTYVHWVLYDIPATVSALAEAATP